MFDYDYGNENENDFFMFPASFSIPSINSIEDEIFNEDESSKNFEQTFFKVFDVSKYEPIEKDMNLYFDYEKSTITPIKINKNVKVIPNNDPICIIENPKYGYDEKKIKFNLNLKCEQLLNEKSNNIFFEKNSFLKKKNIFTKSKNRLFKEGYSNFFSQFNHNSNNVIILTSICNIQHNTIYFNVKNNNNNNNEISNNDSRKKGRKRKQRKFKPDDIRKKIKARFHKTLKNIINENLKQSGSNEFFDLLPQSFVSNISRAKNNQVLNLKYREILEKDFSEELNDSKQKKIDHSKFEKNMKVLKYLDDNPDISKKSGFSAISCLTYKDILNEYFTSEEFQNSIKKLVEQKENTMYIEEYIEKSQKYIEFFENFP